MMTGIRVVTTDRRDKLDGMSRINYQKIYTVEHNAKVYDFGTVHDSDLHVFYNQWMFVLKRDSERNLDTLGGGENRESDYGDEEYVVSEGTARPVGYGDGATNSYDHDVGSSTSGLIIDSSDRGRF
jgi:hypothetical protein